MRVHKAERNSGFTVLELLVVVAILAAAVMLAFPLVRRPWATSPLRSVTSTLVSHLHVARAAAVTNAAEATFDIDLASRHYQGAVAGRPGPLPPALTVTVTAPQAEVLGPARSRIRFFPDGSSTGGTISLADGRSAAVIVIDPFTGGSRVTWRP